MGSGRLERVSLTRSMKQADGSEASCQAEEQKTPGQMKKKKGKRKKEEEGKKKRKKEKK